MSDIHILGRFHAEIHRHLVTNFLNLPSRPIILGISGRPGDGKSSQLDAVLTWEKVAFTRVHAADLESGVAGEPGKYVARAYGIASNAIAKGQPHAIILDDIDTTMGEWAQNTGTVNHQQVLAELMHIADSPSDPGRGFPRRVPFFVTGNRMGFLYGPLRRHRRFRHFPWFPTADEALEVVRVIFQGYGDNGVAEALVSNFPGRPLAFYSDVRHSCVEGRVAQQLLPGKVNMRSLVEQPDKVRSGLRLSSFTRDEVLSVATVLSRSATEGLKESLESDITNISLPA